MRVRVLIVSLVALASAWGSAASPQPILGGFVEGTQAVRVEKNTALGDGDIGERSYPRSEIRVQLTARDAGDREEFFLRVDVVSDATQSVTTVVDLREAYIKLFLADWLDIKFGRQVATWGTGDLIFANDLFAKDWDAFFTALDDSYLKPPQNLLRVNFYAGGTTMEFAVSPHFTPDHLPDGSRLSVFNPFMGRAVGAGDAPEITPPPRTLANGEFFARVSGWGRGAEWALYGYKGFWPTPQGATAQGVLYYPRLWAVGASLRGMIGSLLTHGEVAAYISQDDDTGGNPLIANSQLRGFVGAEKSLGHDWTVGGQYYAEWMQEYDRYVVSLAGSPPGTPVFDEVRSTATGRIGKWARGQTVYISLVGFWGITDQDWHLRPSVSYKITDAVKWTVGGSAIGSEMPYTTFGQFQNNGNIFTRLRYSF